MLEIARVVAVRLVAAVGSGIDPTGTGVPVPVRQVDAGLGRIALGPGRVLRRVPARGVGLEAQLRGLAAGGRRAQGAVDDRPGVVALARFQRLPRPAAVGQGGARDVLLVVADRAARAREGRRPMRVGPRWGRIGRVALEALEGGGAAMRIVDVVVVLERTDALHLLIGSVGIAPVDHARTLRLPQIGHRHDVAQQVAHLVEADVAGEDPRPGGSAPAQRPEVGEGGHLAQDRHGGGALAAARREDALPIGARPHVSRHVLDLLGERGDQVHQQVEDLARGDGGGSARGA